MSVITLRPVGSSTLYTAKEAGAPGEAISIVYLTPMSGLYPTTSVGVADIPQYGNTIIVGLSSTARMVVTGALTSNGITPLVIPALLYAGMINSRPAYTETGDPATGRYTLAWNGAGYNYWGLVDNESGAQWESLDNTAAPSPVMTWTPTGGATGTPTVTAGVSSVAQVIAAVNASPTASELVTATASVNVNIEARSFGSPLSLQLNDSSDFASLLVDVDGDPSQITDINCGSTSPKFGGSINLSAFTGLKNFTCVGNGIESLIGYSDKPSIEKLFFYDNDVSNEFEILTGCTGLKEVDCRDNEITGSIPNLTGLNSLTVFRAYNNNLSGTIQNLNNIGIPNLTVFHYGDNDISGPIPQISGLAKLFRFHCYENNHTGSIPAFTGCTALETFNCYRNSLDGTIPDLSGRNELKIFNCYENNLIGTIPVSITTLPKLETFSCYRNNLTGSIPADLNDVTTLKEFYCYENNLTGAIPDLSGMSTLQIFECNSSGSKGTGGGLSGAIPTLVGLNSLTRFACEGNILTGAIPVISGTGAPPLNTFTCGSNRLSSTIPSLTNLTSLAVFACDNNRASLPSVLGVYGSIPALHTCTSLSSFNCSVTEVNEFAAVDPNIVMPNSLTNFQAQATNLSQAAIDKILKAFAASGSSQKIINLGGVRPIGGTPLVPSYTGGITKTLSGASFSLTNTIVTVTLASHGYIQNQLITVTSVDLQNVFRGTFKVKQVINDDTFQYDVVTSGSIVGSGTATIRTTTNPTDGYAYYQTLTNVSRVGGPCSVIINQP